MFTPPCYYTLLYLGLTPYLVLRDYTYKYVGHMKCQGLNPGQLCAWPKPYTMYWHWIHPLIYWIRWKCLVWHKNKSIRILFCITLKFLHAFGNTQNIYCILELGICLHVCQLSDSQSLQFLQIYWISSICFYLVSLSYFILLYFWKKYLLCLKN